MSTPSVFQDALANHQRGELARARAGYEAVLAAQPGHFDSLHMLGVMAYQEGRYAEATTLIAEALRTRPDHPGACSNLGLALARSGRPEAALAAFDQAIAGNPNAAAAHLNRGNVLVDLGRFEAAVASYDRAIACRPDLVEAHVNKGGALAEAGRPDEAVRCYDAAIRLRPDRPEAHGRRGHALMELADNAAAAASYRAALALDPDYAYARWGLTFSCLPAIPPDVQAMTTARTELGHALDALAAWIEPVRLERAFDALGSSQPFYLAYQERDNRALLSRAGDIAGQVASVWQAARELVPAAGASGGKIRIGIVSDHIREHSVWQAILKGWLDELDRERFELHIFYLGAAGDRITDWARGHVDVFTERLASAEAWARAIVASQIDVLCYPEIGMHALTYRLAALRLAKVQVATWGHPETSGLPSIDYYLSAQLFEPEGAAANYRERLVALPNLGCCYVPEAVPATPLDLVAHGIDAASPILLCPGTPFKYSPEYDAALVSIARRLGTCRFVFFTHKHACLTTALKARLSQVFEAAGLTLDAYASFLPWQRPETFHGLLGQATVFLDSLGFSGFNTAMQAIERDLPVVTLAGRFMRGRLASGLLRRMGLDALVAGDVPGYVDLAVRLSRDADYRETIRAEIRARKPILYRDLEPIRALERFFLEVGRPGIG